MSSGPISSVQHLCNLLKSIRASDFHSMELGKFENLFSYEMFFFFNVSDVKEK